MPTVAEDEDGEILIHGSPRRKTSSWRLQRRRQKPKELWQEEQEQKQEQHEPPVEQKLGKDMKHSVSRQGMSDADMDEEDVDPGWCINFCINTRSGKSMLKRR